MFAAPRSLARLYTLWTASIIAVAIAVSGGVQLWLLYRQTRDAVEQRQALHAMQASASIDRFLEGIATRLHETMVVLDAAPRVDEGAVKAELERLLIQSVAVKSASWFDETHRKRLHVGSDPGPADVGEGGSDRSVPGAQAIEAGPRFGAVMFRRGAEPVVNLAQRGLRAQSGTVTVQVGIRQVSEIVAAIRFGTTGGAYVVDRAGNLLAHSNLRLVLAHTNWADRPQVQAAIERSASPTQGALIESVDTGGRPVVSRATQLIAPDWVLITEQARNEVYAPVARSLGLALALLALAVGAGVGAGALLAPRVTRPIKRLADGARRIGLGRLDHRIEVTRNDEIGQLAMHFNRMAERLSESYATLEANVRQRTSELAKANRELQARKEEAERASLAKTRFLAAASHDLRQPMHTLSMLVGVLQQRITYPEVSRIVSIIQASSEAMENLLNSLLDISRLDAGTIRPSIRDCALGDILRLVDLHYRAHATEKGIRLVVMPCRCLVKTDAALLERVVHNLVSNAIRYTQSGKVLIGCRRRGDHAELQVWDTGPGIAPAHHDAIFEEFFQVTNPERDRSKGLGLGLSIVKRTLQLLGHPIRLRSRPGAGSCFSIDLPLARPSRVCDQPSVRAHRGDRIAGAFVLVIDDEAAAREATEALCREWGAHALGAASADECIERLAEHLRLPDLILSDYRLRDCRDGVEAIHQIRAHVDAPIPAIVVTGDIFTGDIERTAAANIMVLRKPVTPERLLRAIESMLSSEASKDLVHDGSGEPRPSCPRAC